MESDGPTEPTIDVAVEDNHHADELFEDLASGK